MLDKNDLLLILYDLKEQGVEVEDKINTIVSSSSFPLDVLKFVNSIRPFDVSLFYEQIRKNYNNKKSKLYKNLVKGTDNIQEALQTLSALVLQIILYSKHVKEEDKDLFFKHIRAEEIVRVLHNYFIDYNVVSIFDVLKLLKADLKAFESIK